MKTDSTLVWDLPLRIFHWLLALSFAGAYLTAESERWAMVHITLGYTMAGLVAFRLLWGIVGPGTARFSSFVRGPRAARDYLFSLLHRQPQHHLGHNPAGGWAIIAMLVLAAVVVATGWVAQDFGVNWMEALHESSAELMLLLVALHLVAVVVSSWIHGENLVLAMISGYKPGPSTEGITRVWRPIGVLLLAGVVTFWAWQWNQVPAAPEQSRAANLERHAGQDHEDD